jgi:hypothetical protein
VKANDQTSPTPQDADGAKVVASKHSRRLFALAVGAIGATAMVPLVASAATPADGCPEGTYESWTESYDPPVDTISIPDWPVTYVWVDTPLGRYLIGDGTPMNNQTLNVGEEVGAAASVGAPASLAGFCKNDRPTTTPPTTAPPTTAPPTTAPPTTAPPTTAPPTTAPTTTAPTSTAPSTTDGTTTTSSVAANPPTSTPPPGGGVAPPAVTPPATQLPATGLAPWYTAALAACALGAGLFMVRFARRSA